MKKIPEVQKLKDRIIELSDSESDELFIWLGAVRDVNRYRNRPKPTIQQSQQSTLKGITSEQPTD